MRLTPQEPEIPEVGGFTKDNDLFGYRDFADRLANLVRNIDEPLVIVLDGPWGSGKSIFVKQWADLLRGRGASVIQFDAFGSDHYEDAFLALSAEIHAAAKKTLGGNESTTRRYLHKAKKAGDGAGSDRAPRRLAGGHRRALELGRCGGRQRGPKGGGQGARKRGRKSGGESDIGTPPQGE